MNNIQNLHVVIPHINGEAVNHYAGYEQHTKFTYCYDLMQGLVASAPLLIVGKCWRKSDGLGCYIFSLSVKKFSLNDLKSDLRLLIVDNSILFLIYFSQSMRCLCAALWENLK